VSKIATILKVAVAVAVVVALGLALGWLGGRGSGPNPPPQPSPPDQPSAVEPAHSKPVAPVAVEPSLAHPADSNFAAVPAPTTNSIADWEDRVDHILSSNGEADAKARQMLEMFPRLPEAGQVEVAQHLSNLLPDQDYPALSQYLTNATTPEPVLEVLVAGLLNRPNAVRLPLLLEIAREQQNPKAKEAHELLALFLEEDFGQDWAQWQAKLQQWLQDNPD
jgi:hypothetical protein